MSSISWNWKQLFWAAPLAVVVAGGLGFATMMMQPPPAGLDYSLVKATENGLYVGALEAQLEPVAIGPIHSWTVEVSTPEGEPVEQAVITVDGGMPQHGHGLPTSPQVTEYLGDGVYLVEGMKFNMPGWWTLTVEIDGPSGHDEATFNLSL